MTIWDSLPAELGPMAGPVLGVVAYLIAKYVDHWAGKARHSENMFQAQREALDKGTAELIAGLERRVVGQERDLAAAKSREAQYQTANRELFEVNLELRRTITELEQENEGMKRELLELREHIGRIEEMMDIRREDRLDP